jgi:tripartite-type tricarboxylate transporter receptor subunit TctC
MHILFKTVAASLIAFAGAVHAAWPDRPIKVIVPTPAGGSADVIARTVTNELATRLGQAFVIENRPGAAGNIGAAQVARAPADGYTLLMHAVALTVNPFLFKEPGYDIDKSFAPIAMMGVTPNILFVGPGSPVNTLAELMALAKKDRLAFASSGNGTTTHLGAELLFRAANVDVMHVPYAPGTGLIAVAGDQVPIGSAAIPAVVPLAKSGKLRPIAVTSLKRSAALPDVPTVAESGFPNFEATTWFALFAPAGTPEPVLTRLHSEIQSALGAASVKAVFEQQSIEAPLMSRQALDAYVKSETTKWGATVKRLGLKAD